MTTPYTRQIDYGRTLWLLLSCGEGLPKHTTGVRRHTAVTNLWQGCGPASTCPLPLLARLCLHSSANISVRNPIPAVCVNVEIYTTQGKHAEARRVGLDAHCLYPTFAGNMKDRLLFWLLVHMREYNHHE